MEQVLTIRLRCDEATETIDVIPLGDHRYRLADTPFAVLDAVYQGDVIELVPEPDGTHRFRRVVERSPLMHLSWVVPKGFVESSEYAAFGLVVQAVGGQCERIAGGILHVHVPHARAREIEAELEQRIAAA